MDAYEYDSPVERAFAKAFAEEVLGLLGRRRMTKAQLARELGTSPQQLGKYLNDLQPVPMNRMVRIADILSEPLGDIVGRAESSSDYVLAANEQRADETGADGRDDATEG